MIKNTNKYTPFKLSFDIISAAFMYSKGVKYFKNSNLSDIFAIILKKYIVKTKPKDTDNICLLFFINNDMKKIKLEVNNDNTKAIDFYKMNGFAFCGSASADSKYMIKIISR